ncbi:YqgE/AlgH family protein [Phytoactinopolyspora limicola]|uniref:YqgE/AlgH family protein n=1 Tax=Phytoactinopolyspora limicola TaxID=2715536 RepID=UPI00140D50ED|nr:YqgE/AlgH family protein [Phytoactinopolyspora limicola]
MAEARLVGRLLVATPQLRGSTFENSVILMLSHDGDGALGVIVNRPTEVPVGNLLPTWQHVASEPSVIFQGGPVETDSALGLVRLGSGGEPLGVRRVSGEVGVVDLDTPTEVVESAVGGMRVFAGYAGWAADQVEGEIDEGSWYVVDAEPSDAFRVDAQVLWRAVLRRQGGELALMASFPADPTMN